MALVERLKIRIFQPTLPARGATKLYPCKFAHWLFQPTLPARGATPESALMALVERLFQPTLPARGATQNRRHARRQGPISTHAPRTGSDSSHM